MALSTADPNAYLAVGMQAALGTPQTAAAKLRFAKYLSGTDAAADIEVVDLREGGDGLDFGYTYKRAQKVVGQIVVNARPEIVGQLAQFLPGMASWNGASAPALHNFHTGHASFPWATLFVQHPGSTLPQMISDAIFTGLTIEGQSGEPEKWTLPFVGITHGASYADLTPSYASEEPFLYHMSPTFVLMGSGDDKILSYSIERGLGVEELQAQRVTLDDIAVMNADTNAEFTRRYVDATIWKTINMGGGLSPTTSVATSSFRVDHRYGSSGSLRNLEHQLPLLSFRALSLAELDPDGRTVIETISAKALKGATHAMFTQVRNAHASAYAS